MHPDMIRSEITTPQTKNTLPHTAKTAPNHHGLLNRSITRGDILAEEIVEVSKDLVTEEA